MASKLRIVLLFLVIGLKYASGQAPTISYASPQTFNTGTAITPLKPANSGGSVPAIPYSQLSTFAGTAGIRGNVNGTGAAAQFNGVGALAADASGNLYVIDQGNFIRKITNSGVVTTYAGTGAIGSLNGPALQATFVDMSGIAVDANENVYIVEQGNDDVRKITPGGIVSTLAGKVGAYGYADGQDTSAIFANPYGLAVDKSNNVYVMDLGNYLIRKITPTGLVSTIAGKQGVYGAADGPDTSATFSNPSAGAFDANGNLYVTDAYKIRKISTNGMVSTIAGGINPGSADGVGAAASFGDLDAISIDTFGNIYVSDAGNSTIREVTPNGTVTTIAGTAGVTGYADEIGAAAKFGNGVYSVLGTPGSLFVSDPTNSVIRKVNLTGFGIGKSLPTGLTFDGTTGVITGIPVAFSPATDYPVTAYNLFGQSTANVNITISGSLSFPLIPMKIYGVADFSPAVSTDGTLTYLSSNTAVATVVAGNIHVIGVGTSTITASNGSITLSQLLTVNTAPLTIIADNKSKNVNAANPTFTLTYDGLLNGDSASSFTTQATVSTTALTTSAAGAYPINVIGALDNNYTITYIAGTLTILGGSVNTAAPELIYPAALSYTAGVVINTITPVNNGGTVPEKAYAHVSAFAGTPYAHVGYLDGSGSVAKFFNPNGVSLDAEGNLYIADAGNKLVRKITPAGVVTTFAGNGPNDVDKFVYPTGVAVDAAGNVYVADTFNNVIKKVTPQGVVTLFAGGGNQLDGQGTQASFSSPSGITIDQSGNLYIADSQNYLIRKITPSGLVSTLAGQKGVMGSANGQGNAASFSGLTEITVDLNNNIYVTDGNLIRKITPMGLVSTLAGSVAGLVDGTGSAAKFNQPWGIVAVPDGTVYVAELQQVRKITPGGVVTTIIGAYPPSGTAAQNTQGFGFLGGLAVDQSGDLYACDLSANFVAKVTATGYTIDKTLPAGLVFDATTGKISGTPTVALPPTFFTINAYNIGGESTSIIQLSVAPSSNANLSNLSISKGTLTPTFASSTTSYTDAVTNGTASITLTPTTSDPNATVTVNGTTVTSGSASSAIALNVGINTVTVVVTAQDGATKQTYTVTVTRPSTNAKLAGLTLSSGTLSPAFNANTTSYTASVANSSSSITITPTVAVSGATVTVNGTAITSGNASAAIPLTVGSNTITVVITAQDGVTTSTYTITATRAASSNASLANISVSKGTLTPAFASTTTSYTDMVTNGTTSLTITPTTADPTASITVNGTAVTSGSPSGAIALSVGANAITTVVTAQDGTTKVTYTLNVIRPSTNAKLSALTLNNGTLTPAFNTNTTSYTASVLYATSAVTLTPIAAVMGATITVNGTTVSSGSPSAAIALSVGSNTITTVVTAQDGVTKATYTVTVTRQAISSNANLSNITLSKGTLSPAFAAATTNYTDMVTNSTAAVTITPTAADPTATITVNGTAVISGKPSGAFALAVGSNTITIIATAQNGTTTQTYTVNVIRPSTNAKLSALTISSGTLTPAFNANTTSYTASVTNATASVTITPTIAVSGATITVNGAAVISGSPSGAIALSVGANTITTTVTAQDAATTDTYTITVTRAAAGENNSDVAISVGVQNFEPLLANDGITVHQGISPNGDGINDYLQIDNITNYPNNNLKIMTRNGQLIFEAKGYDNATKVFDGHSNKTGQMQLPGTYFYQLDYVVKGIEKQKTGYLVLKY